MSTASSIEPNTLAPALTLVNLIMAANPVVLITLGVLALIAAVASLIYWWDDLKAAFMDFTEPVRAMLTDFFEWFFGLPDRMGASVAAMGAALKLIPSMVARAMADLNPLREFGASMGSSVFEMLNDTPDPTAQAQVVSPSARTAKQIDEQRTTSTAEVTLRDETGRAEVTGGSLGAGITLQPSGAF